MSLTYNPHIFSLSHFPLPHDFLSSHFFHSCIYAFFSISTQRIHWSFIFWVVSMFLFEMHHMKGISHMITCIWIKMIKLWFIELKHQAFLPSVGSPSRWLWTERYEFNTSDLQPWENEHTLPTVPIWCSIGRPLDPLNCGLPGTNQKPKNNMLVCWISVRGKSRGGGWEFPWVGP